MQANLVGQLGLFMSIIVLKNVFFFFKKGQLASIFLTIPVIGIKEIIIQERATKTLKETKVC